MGTVGKETMVGDKLQLVNQEVEVMKCDECEALMVNIDEDQLAPGDLKTLKDAGVRVSNPNTEDAVCIECEIRREEEEHTFKRKVNDYFRSPSHSDDSGFFGGGSFGGGGGFGGFGGGSFSGGGATGSY